METTCKKPIKLTRVPWALAAEVSLLPDGLPEPRWREEAKNVIRRHLTRGESRSQGSVRCYDMVLSGLIREVLTES